MVIVSVEVAVPFAAGVTELVLNAQLGARDGAGDTEQVRFTALLNPFSDFTVIVELPDCPGFTELGLIDPALTVKSGAACSVSVNVVL